MVKLLAPIPYFRRDMICIGYNFRNHAQEIARLRGESDKSAEVANPIYFSKRTAYSTGPDAPIPFVPGYAENLDCGVEVAAVIGRDALNITPEAAGDYIFGYTIGKRCLRYAAQQGLYAAVSRQERRRLHADGSVDRDGGRICTRAVL